MHHRILPNIHSPVQSVTNHNSAPTVLFENLSDIWQFVYKNQTVCFTENDPHELATLTQQWYETRQCGDNNRIKVEFICSYPRLWTSRVESMYTHERVAGGMLVTGSHVMSDHGTPVYADRRIKFNYQGPPGNNFQIKCVVWSVHR
jgi:hypothetical protein